MLLLQLPLLLPLSTGWCCQKLISTCCIMRRMSLQQRRWLFQRKRRLLDLLHASMADASSMAVGCTSLLLKKQLRLKPAHSHLMYLSLLLLSGTFQITSIFDAAEAFIELPPQAAWVCRISETGDRCGNVFASEHTKEKGGICREKDCCSQIAVSADLQYGDICTSNKTACKVIEEDFSYGKCNRSDQCDKCSKYSECNYDDTVRGGVWCLCRLPGKGSGITCEKDPCAGDPCFGGICSASSSSQSGYECQCYPGFVRINDSAGNFLRCLDICSTGICGPGALYCVNGLVGHMCACGRGFVNAQINSNETCVKPDVCAISPCGPSDSVESCKNTSSSSYDCTCKDGYTKRVGLRGNQYCTKT